MCNDFVLQLAIQIVEIFAIAAHTNDQVAVLFRMCLCIQQGFLIHQIDLQLNTLILEVLAVQIGRSAT